MIRYQLELHDTATTHMPGETVDFRPSQLSAEPRNRKLHVFLCFATPFVALTKDGKVTGRPGDCMVVSPSFHEYHGPTTDMIEGFVNDWLHVIVNDITIFQKDIPLPLNTLISTGNPYFFRPFIEKIDRVLLKENKLRDINVSNIIESLCILLSEKSLLANQSNSDMQWDRKLVEIRLKMNTHVAENWSVSRLAEETGISISRFSVLYRMRFRVSPMDDLIFMRLINAKKLLLSTSMTLREISTRVGFQSESYFCRMFKARYRMTPSEYRQQ